MGRTVYASCVGLFTFFSAGSGLAQTPIFTIRSFGLTGGDHTESGGLFPGQTNNQPSAWNTAGQIAGTAERYDGGSSGGQDAWYYSPTTNQTFQIGLNDASHFNSVNNVSNSTITGINAVGAVIGYSEKYYLSSDLGPDAWVYSPQTNSSSIIGLRGAAHTQNYSYSFNQPQLINAQGAVAGAAYRYISNSYAGVDAWIYSPTSNSSTIIGLTDALHVQSGGTSVNSVVSMNDSGDVVGTASRYNGSNGAGLDAWLYNPLTSITTPVGLTGGAYTSGAGYSYNTVQAINNAGQFIGYAQRGTISGTAQDAYIYQPTTASYQFLGLTDALHTESGRVTTNTPFGLDANGDVVGSAVSYASNSGGTDAWYYSASTGVTSTIGLTDALHTNASGLHNNTPSALTSNGIAYGTSTRFIPGSTQNGTEGYDAWIYFPSQNTTYQINSNSQSSTGVETASIEYVTSVGAAYGTYDKYVSGTVYDVDAFQWSLGTGFTDLGTEIQGGLSASGWSELEYAFNVNQAGQVLGTGYLSNGGLSGFLLTPVPEANGLWASVAIAAVPILGRRSRRRVAANQP